MPDKHTVEIRSYNMSRIRSSETTPEIKVRKFLFSCGFRYRKNVKNLPGKPDIVLSKYKTVIFVNGCFWHGHACKAAKLPETRTEFWEAKITGNKERDKRQHIALKALGWNLIIIWQCEIKTFILFDERMKKLIDQIKKRENNL